MNAIEFRLDYFQIYELKMPHIIPRAVSVSLKGQFDKEPVNVRLGSLVKFADRVSKNKEKLFDTNAHLTWYNFLEIKTPAVVRRVIVANQFYPQGEELFIYNPVGLMVPARKRLPPRVKYTIKTNLDHYLVYRVLGGKTMDLPPINLVDQFSSRETRLFQPLYFAVPVQKTYKTETAIINPDAHLTIYQVGFYKSKMPITIDTSDQISPGPGIQLEIALMLAAPSKKVEWKEE
jgi:hypothetical protein